MLGKRDSRVVEGRGDPGKHQKMGLPVRPKVFKKRKREKILEKDFFGHQKKKKQIFLPWVQILISRVHFHLVSHNLPAGIGVAK